MPEENVEDGLLMLHGLAPTQANELVEYFDATYVTGSYRLLSRVGGNIHVRAACLLDSHLKSWNVHQATVEGSHRPNDNCET